MKLSEETYKTQLGMLRMALNMDEYCMVLELKGAKFYKDPKECEYLKDVLLRCIWGRIEPKGWGCNLTGPLYASG